MSVKISNLIDDFRSLTGDATCNTEDCYLITILNLSLQEMARERGLEKLFETKATVDLATIDKTSGVPTAAWELSELGTLMDIREMKILRLNGESCQIPINYMQPETFWDTYPFPERSECGVPTCFTIEQIGVCHRLVFNCPPCDLFSVDLTYSTYPGRIECTDETLESGTINFPAEFSSLLLKIMSIKEKQEATSFDHAQIYYNEYDFEVQKAIEFLSRNPSATNYRKVSRSF